MIEVKGIPMDDIKRRELSYKASHDVLKAVGIMPTLVQSQVITNIYNNNRNQVLSLFAQEILDNYFRQLTEEDKERED